LAPSIMACLAPYS